MALNRAQFEAKSAKSIRRFDVVALPTGGEARVQSLTRSEQRKWRKSCQKKNGEADPAKQAYFDDVLLSMTVVDDDGAAVFTTNEALAGCWDAFDMADTNAMLRAATKINNMGDEPEPEQAVKNSDETPGNGTAGGSADDMESK